VSAHREASSALQYFQSRPGEFDLVVTDLALRGMSGIDLAEALLRKRPDLPVIMTSGHSAWRIVNGPNGLGSAN